MLERCGCFKCNVLTNAWRTDGSTLLYWPWPRHFLSELDRYGLLYNTATAGLERGANNFNTRCCKLLPTVRTGAGMLLMTLRTTSMFSGTYCSRVKSDPGVSSTAWGRGGGYRGRQGALARVHSHPVELVLRGEGVVRGVQRTGRAPCHAVLRPGSLQVCQSAWGKVKLEF